MKTKVIKHEDNRRILTEYVSNSNIKRCKVIETKEDCVLGKHFHNKTISYFYMLKGSAEYSLEHISHTTGESGTLSQGECLYVPNDVIHTFKLPKDSIMLETASEPYEKEDEISVA